MSKRDDDPDLEVGMTTAERRRRRRRGAGLRVPSDNVPRRNSTPPVVAPVPEDPALAMSIAYTFTAADSEPAVRPSTPSFEHHESIPTVIDPVSGPVEQVDFETKTREMSAVDLEALGLSDAGASGVAIPVQRSSAALDLRRASGDGEAADGGFRRRDTTEPGPPPPARTVSVPTLVELAVPPTTLDVTLDTSADAGADDGALEPGEAAELSAAAELFDPPPLYKAGRAQTVSLSEDDLEEVREAARLAIQPAVAPAPAAPQRSQSISIPPPMPATKPVEPRGRAPEPASVPEIDLAALEDRAAETSGEYEVDVDGIVDAKPSEDRAVAAVAPAPVAVAVAVGPAPVPAPPPEPRGRPSPPPAGYPVVAATVSREVTIPPASTPRDSQPIPLPPSAPPPPPVAKAPPMPPPQAKKERQTPPAAVEPAKDPARETGKDVARDAGKDAARDAGKDAKRAKAWFVDLFDEDYLRTLPFLTPQATQAEAEFAIDALGLQPGAQVLDVGCGYGRHAMELAARGFHVVGLDLSTPLLVRGGEEAHRRGLTINFVRGDMRELDFENQFDGAYCLFSTFGYFDDETNKKTVANIARALRPGGRVLIEILNRDYVIADLPTRVWWEGDGCVVLEEVDLNYFSSRIQVNRSVVFDDGRQLEQEISVRAYALHEVGKLLHAAGFRVLEVSGAYHTRGRFFGNQSRHIIVVAERKDPSAG